ncbi:MAG: hypothetical protein F6K10_13720 [Moorea sp. SIO2B7]|nr:hypothetical protein [Moorena sp. SIO2B7]
MLLLFTSKVVKEGRVIFPPSPDTVVADISELLLRLNCGVFMVKFPDEPFPVASTARRLVLFNFMEDVALIFTLPAFPSTVEAEISLLFTCKVSKLSKLTFPPTVSEILDAEILLPFSTVNCRELIFKLPASPPVAFACAARLLLLLISTVLTGF